MIKDFRDGTLIEWRDHRGQWQDTGILTLSDNFDKFNSKTWNVFWASDHIWKDVHTSEIVDNINTQNIVILSY